ncbi:hypothetical protein ATE84_2815 [Aquimarina sp. MAR_2010_214]|uniref:hypothetical protein n=1 Tax=Aquimarina sp. MAR_2010_214 TaxID=1250026 RepID=UPI000C703C14|nr:hypothetical protein [Aquimarina sp. MAR_2010_214]PKV50749.1 hypothetical protein ATE84_2815 [Aquimarina sp. MAR_2010_214]
MIQPYYMLEFTAVACLFEIRVNDIPVVHMNMPNQISTRIPVNYGITESGKQQVSVKMLPVLGNITLQEGAELKYKLELFDTINGFEFQDEITSYKSKPIEKDSELPIIVNENIFLAVIPYQVKDFWKEGEDLKDVDDLRSKLEHSYYNLSKDISASYYDSFRQKIKIREENMVTSMYIKPAKAASRISNLETKFSTGYVALPILKDAVLVYSAYGKKVSLKKLNGDPALSFINKEKRKQLFLDIDFYLPKGSNALEII